MRLAMLEVEGRRFPVVESSGGGWVDLSARGLHCADLHQIIEAGEETLREAARIASRERTHFVKGGRLLCPLSRPEKIMCIGKNYAEHARELGSGLPEKPVLFAKFPNTLAAPGQAVELPPQEVSRMIDYEAELAVVIGRRCKNVAREEALSKVFGYCCANDLTMRDAQKADGQWTRAKSPDAFCPLGPWIVTADEIADPQNLPIRLTLNGRVMQESNTAQMVFGVAELLSYLSSTMTLQPGDLLLTGTPPGVGAGREPQVFLGPGDRVAVEIEGLGKLENVMK